MKKKMQTGIVQLVMVVVIIITLLYRVTTVHAQSHPPTHPSMATEFLADEVGRLVIYRVGEEQRWARDDLLALPVNDVAAQW
jgi:hypothetical protein